MSEDMREAIERRFAEEERYDRWFEEDEEEESYES